MRTTRVLTLIVGCLLLLPGVGMLLGGSGLALGYAFGRNDEGWFELNLPDLSTDGAAITALSPTLTSDLSTPGWLADAVETQVRVRVTATDPADQVFLGLGAGTSVAQYLSGVPRSEITAIESGRIPVYQVFPGADQAGTPGGQTFWDRSAAGPGQQELEFDASGPARTLVLMNADGSAGITTTATMEVRAPFLLPLALMVAVLGLLLTGAAVALIVVGTRRRPRHQGPAATSPTPAGITARAADNDHPVMLTATLDSGLSRWKWLVKWVLALPHLIVLALLWPAFLVVTAVAGAAILFTGSYPRPLFDFTSGVLRWTCRVSYYAFHAGMGTDRYPPFSLGAVPGYPITLDIAYPIRLSRGLVLVKWWLLAIPHYLILGLLLGNWLDWTPIADSTGSFGPIGSAGVLGLIVVAAGVVLLFQGSYPRPLFDLIIGLNRWIFRVAAYAALMTDRYPPFRLDQGGSEPDHTPDGPQTSPTATPALAEAATR